MLHIVQLALFQLFDVGVRVEVLVLNFSVGLKSVQVPIIELVTGFYVNSLANYEELCEKIPADMCCHSKNFLFC